MIPELTPWSVRPLVNPAGGRLGVQIMNCVGELVAQVLGGSEAVLAMAITLVSTVNAKPQNLDIRLEALCESEDEQPMVHTGGLA